jgi:hypothetical protein
MFGLLDKLNGVFSKTFVVASLLPVLVASLLNATLLYLCNPAFRHWQQTPRTGTMDTLFNWSGISLVLVTVAYLAASATPVLTKMLEGRYLPGFVERGLVQRHVLKAALKRRKLKDLRADAVSLKETSRAWIDSFKHHQPATRWDKGDCWYKKLLSLREQRLQDEVLPYNELRDVFDGMPKVEGSDATIGDPCLDRDPLTGADIAGMFIDLTRYAIRRNLAEIVATFTYLHRAYGTTIAATRLGNQSNALAAYSEARYGFSLDIAWGRLKKVLLDSDSNFNDVLEGAKAQMDAVVLLFWLILATTLTWSLALTIKSISLPLFLTVSIVGSIICSMLYSLAVGAHDAFADIVRSVVDLCRFKLLEALHLQLPEGPSSEHRLWESVRHRFEFNEDAEIRYVHGPSAGGQASSSSTSAPPAIPSLAGIMAIPPHKAG